MTSKEEIVYLPHEEAVKLVAAIQEEEDIERPDHRVLTVYNHDDKELCWFDFAEVQQTVSPVDKADEKEVVSNYIMHHLPDWVIDI